MSNNPNKKAPLPRRNKAGKKPVITHRRRAQLAHAAINTGRRGAVPTVLGRKVWESNPHKRNPSRNPGKDLMSHAERSQRLRGSNSVRGKKTKNPK